MILVHCSGLSLEQFHELYAQIRSVARDFGYIRISRNQGHGRIHIVGGARKGAAREAFIHSLEDICGRPEFLNSPPRRRGETDQQLLMRYWHPFVEERK